MPLNRLLRVSVLLALGVTLYRFSFNLPFFPPFLKYDSSEIPVLVGALAFGPWVGVGLELAKNLLHALLKGGANPVGLAANFAAGSVLVVGTVLTYRLQIARRRPWLAVAVGATLMAVAMLPLNIFFFLPAHGIKPGTIPLTALQLLTPFNLVKGAISAGVGVLAYERLYFVLSPGQSAEAAIIKKSV